jgi:RNA polymerase sigma-70 factor (ECF subfamily)
MSEQAAMAQAALMRLDKDQRQIIVLHDVNGCSYAEIADILGCASGTVKSRLHRARMSLRRAVMEKTRDV